MSTGDDQGRVPAPIRAVLDAAPDATVLANRLGEIVFLNVQAQALFGFGAEEVLGQPVEVLIPERFRARHPSHRNRYFEDPRTRPMGAALELFGLRKDGTEFPAEISLSPLETDDGIFAITAVRDVSQRKRVESKFRGLLEAAPDAMVIADQRGRITLVNAQAERLFGYGREELLGQLVEALIPSRFRKEHRAHRTGYFAEPRPRPMGAGLELFGVRKDGTEFPAEISLSPLETEDGTVAITAIRDITDRRRAEEERARLHAQLETLVADQRRFFTNLSHELRTPLTLILGTAERLLAGAEPEDRHRFELGVLSRNARTLLRQVNELLEVARMEAGGLALEPAPLDVAWLLRLAASHFEAAAAERGITLTVDAPAGLPWVADLPKVLRVLLNLLSNAFRFTPPGGRVRCTARAGNGAGEGQEAEALTLEVADSGPGIPAAQREAVFLRFRQLEGAGQQGGTGLGLAIAREFVELHRGRIAAEDAPEGGALFRVTLPRLAPPAALPRPSMTAADVAQAAREAAAPLVAGVPAAASAAAEEGAPRVLVVEDHPEMRQYIRDALGPGVSVALASGGREGLERAAALRPDLVITDLMMPGGSGEELVAALRGRPDLEDVAVIVLTAKADEALRVRLLQAGAQDHLLKPFAPEELRTRAENLLAAKRTRDLLRQALSSRSRDLETLARELVARQGELEAALEATRLAREEADRASRAKSDFLALVSHELRTPLAALRLQLDILARGPRPEAAQRALQRLGAASARMAGLVEALLEQARIASGRLTLRWQSVDVAGLVADAVEEIRPAAEVKGLAVRFSASPGLPPAWTDPSLLRVLVANLLGNAVKFTSAGSIEVGVAAADGGQRVVVADTGPGIAEADQQRIFEPFEQLAPIRSKHLPGAGLGLALVRQLGAALGLTVQLATRPGAGSTFAVVVPPGSPERPATAFVPDLGGAQAEPPPAS